MLDGAFNYSLLDLRTGDFVSLFGIAIKLL